MFPVGWDPDPFVTDMDPRFVTSLGLFMFDNLLIDLQIFIHNSDLKLTLIKYKLSMSVKQ